MVIYSLCSNRNIFAGTRDSGIYISSNNGTNWVRSSLSLQVSSFDANVNFIFAGAGLNGVYVSSNNGETWTQRSEGLANNFVNDLCILNNYIFAGTGAKGIGNVFRRPLNEFVSLEPVSNETPNII
jgi:photosystem II stability/assembly factor-like uncharacterized protein